MALIVGLLFFVLFVCCVLACVMVGGSSGEMGVSLEKEGERVHGAILTAVEDEKHRLITDAMKASREAALKQIGGGA